MFSFIFLIGMQLSSVKSKQFAICVQKHRQNPKITQSHPRERVVLASRADRSHKSSRALVFYAVLYFIEVSNVFLLLWIAFDFVFDFIDVSFMSKC